MRIRLSGFPSHLGAVLATSLLEGCSKSLTEVVIDELGTKEGFDGFDGIVVAGADKGIGEWQEVMRRSFERDREKENAVFLVASEWDIESRMSDIAMMDTFVKGVSHKMPSVFEMLEHNKPRKPKENTKRFWPKPKHGGKGLDPFEGCTESRAKQRKRLGKKRRKKK